MVFIRTATAADLPTLSRLAALANVDDPMDNYLYPFRRTHYQSYISVHGSRLKSLLQDRFVTIDVAVLSASTSEASSKEEIVGFATWRRETERKDVKRKYKAAAGMTQTKKAKFWMLDHLSPPVLLYPCASFQGQWHNFLFERWCNKAEDLEPDEYYEVDLACVHPKHQRKGIGKALIENGLQRARKDNVEVWLCASVPGQGLYQKLGFEFAGWLQWAPGSPEPEPVGRKCPRMRWVPPSLAGATSDQLPD